MKKQYEKPTIEVIHIDYEDIITTSNGCDCGDPHHDHGHHNGHDNPHNPHYPDHH